MTNKDIRSAKMYWRTVLVVCLATHVFAKIDYTGHQVLGVTPNSMRTAIILNKLLEDDSLNLDPWTESARESTIPVRVPPASLEKFKRRLDYHNIPYEVILPDVQRLIDQEAASVHGPSRFIDKSMIRFRRSTGGPSRYIVDETLRVLFNTITTFPSHQITNDWIDALSELLPEIGTTEVIGNSTQGRQLKLIKIGRPRADGKPKKIILVDALIHAREWVTQSTALYMIFQLMKLDGVDPNITSLVNTFDWHILPVLNPDGYDYSQREDRFWRKTRSYHEMEMPVKKLCVGVDANRNFQYHWKRTEGHCGPSYSGPRPFSEPESRALKNHILRHKENIIMYLSLHSPVQQWLTPWGHTMEKPHDHKDIERVAEAAAHAMRQKHGLAFQATQISTFLYQTVHGSSIDWAKGAAGIKYSFAPELRRPESASSRNSYIYWSPKVFIVPRNQLIPAGEETWAAVKAAVKEVMLIENIKPHNPTRASVLDEEELEELEEIVKNLPPSDRNELLQQTDQALQELENGTTGIDVASGQPQPDASSDIVNLETRRTFDRVDGTSHQRATPHQPMANADTGSPQRDRDDLLHDDTSAVQQAQAASFHPVTQLPDSSARQQKGSPLSGQDELESISSDTGAFNDRPEFTPAREPRPAYF